MYLTLLLEENSLEIITISGPPLCVLFSVFLLSSTSGACSTPAVRTASRPRRRREPSPRPAVEHSYNLRPNPSSNTIYYDAEGRRLEQPPTLRSLLRRPLPASVMLAKANAGGH